MNPIIVTEPVANFRKRAWEAMCGRVSILYISGVIYMICLTVPVAVIQALAGTFGKFAEAMLGMASYTDLQDWYADNVDKLTATSNIAAMYTLLVTGCFILGFTIIHIAVIRRQEATIWTLFDGFSHLPKAVGIYLITSIMTFLWTLLFIVPGVIAYYRYRLAYLLVIDNPKIGIIEAIRQSGDIMRGNKQKMFFLDLSFIGWCIPPVFLLLFLLDYFTPIALQSGGNGFFALCIGAYILAALLFSLIIGYRGVATADFYQKIKPSSESSSAL